MKVTKNAIALLCITVLLMCTASGCSSNNGSDANTAENDVQSTSNEGSSTETTDTKENQEPITLRICDWSDSTKTRRDAFNEQYMKDHPNVTIEYTMITVDQFKSTVVSLINSGDAPDLFPVPVGMTLGTAIGEDWYTSLDSLLTQDFIDTINDDVFAEGVSMVNGQIYSLPDQLAITNALIFYNKDLLAAAGIKSVPTTYSEFIEACKKVTEAGNGAYYGFIEGGQQLNRLDVMLRSWVQVAGGRVAPTSNALTVDGKAPYDSAEMIATFDVFNQLVKDGSIHPDSINISAPEARELFAQGQAAFLTQGSWCIAPWAENNPDLNYGVMAIPSPDNSVKGSIAGGDMGPWIGIYSQSKNKEAAAEYLMALYSEEFQGAIVEDGGFISIVNGINEKYMTNPQMLSYYNIAKETQLAAPVATKRDALVYNFYTEVKDIQPNLAALLQGVISGGLDNYDSALTTFSEETTVEWKRAAQAVGLDYNVFEFPNWDPTKAYTEEDYNSLN